MSDEKSQQQTSTESTVAGAAKTGKAISNIAKGAAAGGAHGAAIEAGKSSAKWLIPLIAAVLLPLILVAMLPSIIFGSLLGDGTDSPNGISNDEVLVQNMTAINEGISSILSEGLTDVLERILHRPAVMEKRSTIPLALMWCLMQMRLFPSIAHTRTQILHLFPRKIWRLCSPLTRISSTLLLSRMKSEKFPLSKVTKTRAKPFMRPFGSIPSPIMEKRILPIRSSTCQTIRNSLQANMRKT